MPTMSTPMVVQHTSLSDFLAETTSRTKIRIALTEKTKHTNIVDYLVLQVDITAINIHNELIWLHWERSLQRIPGRDEFATPNAQRLYKQFPEAVDALRKHLSQRGYRVLPGRYALPDVPLISGDIGIQWNITDDDLTWHLQEVDG